MDLVMFMSQNFDFVKLKDELTTGSSIMPHKKNPDVLELIRAKCNRVQAGEFDVNNVINNLPSGYHRDFQLLKEIVFPAISSIKDCIKMMGFVVENIEVKDNIIDNDLYKYIGSVDVINDKVKKGVPFREAYVQVASEIEQGNFVKVSDVNYSHTGSIGNLSNDKILKKLSDIVNNYETGKYIGFPERFVGMIKEEMK
jgi:argininosuccinate lyase